MVFANSWVSRARGSQATGVWPLRWRRQFVAQKYDGSCKPGPGRPRTAAEIGLGQIQGTTPQHGRNGSAGHRPEAFELSFLRVVSRAI